MRRTKPVAAPMVARVYLRVSTDAQDLERQEAITTAAKAAGYYVAGIYREKASGARADRPELLRMIGDLQPGAMRQWSRWCLHPEYLVGVEPGAREAYERARFEILSLSFTDDWMMPQRNVDRLHAHFRSARRESRRIGPAQAGGPIGHMGFFRSRYRETLWPIAGDWLLERAAGARRS